MRIQKVRVGKKTIKVTIGDPVVNFTFSVDQIGAGNHSAEALLKYQISSDGRQLSWSDLPDVEPIFLDTLTGQASEGTQLSPVTHLPIGTITGLHKLHQSLDQNPGLRSYHPTPDVAESALLAWLELNPLIVQKQGKKDVCVANTRAYGLAFAQLNPDTLVPIRRYMGRNDQRLKMLIAADRLLTPLAQAEKAGLFSRLYHTWGAMQQGKYPLILQIPQTPHGFAQAVGVDPRTLRAVDKGKV